MQEFRTLQNSSHNNKGKKNKGIVLFANFSHSKYNTKPDQFPFTQILHFNIWLRENFLNCFK